MVDFRFYLNQQGIRGQKGEKGDTGFSPSIVEEVNTLTDYRLKIINEFDEFVTDNLRGSDYFDITDPNGTYLRFDKETGRAYTGALDQATSEAVGGARLASTSDMEAFSENTIVTPALFADSLANLIVSPDGSLNITQNEQTSKTEITFNSSTLDAVRAEINRVKQDLETESQTRLNADNQQQVAIDAERRERETQDNALQNQLSHLSDSYVTLSTEQDITGRKYFSNTIRGRDIALGIDKANNTWGILGSSTNSLTMGDSAGTIGFSLYKATSTSSPHFDINSADVRFTKGIPSVTQSGSKDYLVTQNNVFSGDNITVTKFGNGVKISSTGGAGAIIDDSDPATDKVYSSSKTSDLVGELGNEVNGIAGRLNTLEGEVKVATTENLGLVQPDGTTITIDSDGKITAVGGGDLPDNLVTTDQIQDITATKKFNDGCLTIFNTDKTMYSSIAKYITESISIGKDGTESIYEYLKPSQTVIGNKIYLEKGYWDMSTFSWIGWASRVPCLEDFKEGSNIQLVKDENTGSITINATGGGSAPEVDNVTIEINEDGKLQTTVDINELQSKVEDLQLYKFPNATIEGDPTINNGQVSNFSTTNYLRFPFEFETKGRTWLLNGSFDTGSDVTTQQNIIDSLASVALAVRSGRLVLALSTNGTSFDLGEHLSMSDIEPNTKYYFKLSFSGTQYLLSLSTDKIDYMPEVVVSSTSPIASRPMTISSSGHPYGDTINLNDWDLTVGNVLVWQGMDDVGVASRLDVNVSNITETGKQAIKDIVGGGSGESYTKEETNNLLANKEDKLTAGENITIQDNVIGLPYTDGYKGLIANNTVFPKTKFGYTYVTDKVFNLYNEDMYLQFTITRLKDSVSNEEMGIYFGGYDGSNAVKIYKQGSFLYLAININGAQVSAKNLLAILELNKSYYVKFYYDHTTRQTNTKIVEVDTGVVIREYDGVVTSVPTYYIGSGIACEQTSDPAFVINAKDIVFNNSSSVSTEHTISAELSSKTKSEISGLSMPSDRYIDLELGASGSEYIAPANGWYVVNKIALGLNQHLTLSAGIVSRVWSGSTDNQGLVTCIPVKKGNTLTVSYAATGATQMFRFYYAEGDK